MGGKGQGVKRAVMIRTLLGEEVQDTVSSHASTLEEKGKCDARSKTEGADGDRHEERSKE